MKNHGLDKDTPCDQPGFTLIEMIVVIAMISILVGIGMPSYTQFISNQRLTTQANDFAADTLLARSEAANRGIPVFVCSSTTGNSCSGTPAQWEIGRIVFVDADGSNSFTTGDTILHVSRLPSGTTVTTSGFPNADWIGFLPSGGMNPAATSGSFKLCLSNVNTGRLISLDAMGRPSVTKVSCP